jgi:hypothetical protein
LTAPGSIHCARAPPDARCSDPHPLLREPDRNSASNVVGTRARLVEGVHGRAALGTVSRHDADPTRRLDVDREPLAGRPDGRPDQVRRSGRSLPSPP